MNDPRRIMPNANNNTTPLNIQRGEQTRTCLPSGMETVFSPANSWSHPDGGAAAHHVPDGQLKVREMLKRIAETPGRETGKLTKKSKKDALSPHPALSFPYPAVFSPHPAPSYPYPALSFPYPSQSHSVPRHCHSSSYQLTMNNSTNFN